MIRIVLNSYINLVIAILTTLSLSIDYLGISLHLFTSWISLSTGLLISSLPLIFLFAIGFQHFDYDIPEYFYLFCLFLILIFLGVYWGFSVYNMSITKFINFSPIIYLNISLCHSFLFSEIYMYRYRHRNQYRWYRYIYPLVLLQISISPYIY